MQQHPLIKEYLDIAFRRRWWIVIPAVVGLLGGVVSFLNFNKLYKAETRIQLRSQSISRAVLNPIVEVSPGEVLPGINGEITSEKYVQEVESKLQLVGKPRGPRDLTELAKRLQGAVELGGLSPRSRQFDLSVTWNDPRIAASIANTLAEIYIRRNQEIRSDLTNKALVQLRETRERIQKDLEDVRAKIQTFRGEHKFELSSQQQSNLSAITTNNNEIDRLVREISASKGKIANNELQLRLPAPVTSAPVTAADQRKDELIRLRAERERLGQSLTDQHPRIKALDAQIAELEKQLGMQTTPGGGSDPVPGPSAVELERGRLRNENDQLKRDVERAEAKIRDLQGQNAAIQVRLDRTPQWQIELDKLDQAEKTLQQQFDEARSKESKATEGAEVEQSNQSERFEVLTVARPPKDPFFPDLRLFLLAGLACGAGLGVAMVLLLEVFDQSFKSEEQLAASIDVAILAVIPDLTRLPADAQKRGGAKRAKGRAARNAS